MIYGFFRIAYLLNCKLINSQERSVANQRKGKKITNLLFAVTIIQIVFIVIDHILERENSCLMISDIIAYN